jgi:glucose/arabinose dehydrogenase
MALVMMTQYTRLEGMGTVRNVILCLFLLFVLAGCESETVNHDDNKVSAKVKSPETRDSTTEESVHSSTENQFSDLSTEDWEVEVMADKLDYPWDIDMIGNVTVITENVGSIVIFKDGELKRYDVETSDPIVHDGGSGLLGMELAADFLESGIGYLYYSYNSGSGLGNKVVQVLYDGASWQETKVLLDGIPGHQLYNGGRIAIGPDGCLYVATGWAHLEESAQDLNSFAGKILRMKLDGSVPDDNPFPNSYVYSFGHRNPQGLAWNDEGTILYSSEHGSSAHDEINIIEPGKNYGWPEISGSEEKEGMERPIIHSGNDTWAPSGIAYFQDRLFVAGLKGQSIYVYNQSEGSMDVVFRSEQRLRFVLPYQGALYVIQ